MHEMSLCERLVQVIEDQARQEGFVRVKTVYLEVGALACVELDALRFCFKVICRGTRSEGARLAISQPLAEARCVDCGRDVMIANRLQSCPHCGGIGLHPQGGEQMRITELEVY